MNNNVKKTKQIEHHNIPNGYEIEFLNDVRFNSPSTACTLVKHAFVNGWDTWKVRGNDKQIDYLRSQNNNLE